MKYLKWTQAVFRPHQGQVKNRNFPFPLRLPPIASSHSIVLFSLASGNSIMEKKILSKRKKKAVRTFSHAHSIIAAQPSLTSRKLEKTWSTCESIGKYWWLKLLSRLTKELLSIFPNICFFYLVSARPIITALWSVLYMYHSACRGREKPVRWGHFEISRAPRWICSTKKKRLCFPRRTVLKKWRFEKEKKWNFASFCMKDPIDIFEQQKIFWKRGSWWSWRSWRSWKTGVDWWYYTCSITMSDRK